MSSSHRRAAVGALAAMGAALWFTPAYPHAVCGPRIFPATLGIDDPGVNDEFSPTFLYLPSNSGGMQEFDGNFSWSKTIIPNVDITVSDTHTWLHPGGYGWEPLNTEVQWGNFCWPEHELMATVSFGVDWGNTATGAQATPLTAYQPVIDVGKGFGDLPTSMNWLRSAAVTAELSETLPDHSFTNGNPNTTNVNWGFTLQYSLPYYNANVGEISNDFFKHLIPLTEFTFSRPISNFAPGVSNVTTGTIQPGAVYITGTYQVAVEAVIPLNGASGHGVGVIASLDLYLDDILPDTIGKPLFNPFGAK
jgi:hypothetical protein